MFETALFLLTHAISVNGPSSADLVRQLGQVVGVTTGVLPNQYNMLAQDLSAKEQQLDAREAELNAREADIARMNGEGIGREMGGIYAGGAILAGLVALNFYFDVRRRRASEKVPSLAPQVQGDPIDVNEPHDTAG